MALSANGGRSIGPAILMLIAGVACPTLPQAMAAPGAAAEVISIHYTRDVGWSESIAAEITRREESTVDVGYNEDQRPEIGVYRLSLGERRFVDLLALLEASGYEKLPSADLLRPGSKTTSVGILRAGERVPTLRVFETIPPSLAPTLRALEAMIDDLKKHPLRVLRGKIEWASSKVVRGQAVVLSIVLTNPGRGPVHWSSPLSPAAEWNGIRLAFTKVGEKAERQQDLTGADVHLVGMGAATGSALILAPGQTITVEIRPKLDIPSGNYQVRIELHEMSGDEKDPHRIGGTLSLDAGRIAVKRESWWKIWR